VRVVLEASMPATTLLMALAYLLSTSSAHAVLSPSLSISLRKRTSIDMADNDERNMNLFLSHFELLRSILLLKMWECSGVFNAVRFLAAADGLRKGW
jgi:hypothetical protein